MTGDSVSLTALAGAQGGVLLTVQALEGGWPRRCLNRRLREESWTPIHRGAWAEPGREVNAGVRLRAVQLQRPEWVVSHRARWASGPFHLGPDGWRTAHSVHPLVLGPENIPVIKDPERASQDVARVLEERQIPTLASTRERITACADAAVLTRWLDRAFTVTDAEDLFSQD